MKAHPWEPQPGEPSRAFRAFALYRDLGPDRSLDLVHQRLYRQKNGRDPKSKRRPGYIINWSIDWSWGERVAAYELHLEREALKARLDAIRQMNREHITIARRLKLSALEKLENLDPGTLKPRDLLAFLSEAVKMERQARGEPEYILQAQMEDSYHGNNAPHSFPAFERGEDEEAAVKAAHRFIKDLSRISENQ